MTVLDNLKSPNSITLELKTLTPIHTGGIGQYGEQLHPSGLLGCIRSFSCLLAAATGNKEFETEVWGTTTQENHNNVHAKRIALSWDVSRLETQELPEKVLFQEPSLQNPTHQHRGWFFNVAQKGEFKLTLTKRGISDVNWQLLLLALRIQILHASFGAKDQFGLGVVKIDKLPDVEKLSPELVKNALTDKPNLRNTFFAEIRFSKAAPSSFRDCLENGLRYRAHLRGSFRKSNEKDLRHYLFGALNEYGSAINVSAVYPLNEKESALRIWGVLPHTTSRKVKFNRDTILNRIKKALENDAPQRASSINWQICSTENFATWINQLNLLSKPTTVQRNRKVIRGSISQ